MYVNEIGLGRGQIWKACKKTRRKGTNQGIGSYKDSSSQKHIKQKGSEMQCTRNKAPMDKKLMEATSEMQIVKASTQ